MRKKIVLFALLICVLLSLVTGCRSSVVNQTIIDEVTLLLEEEYGTVYWCRYYVEDNGYHIIQYNAGVGVTVVADYYAAGVCFAGAYSHPLEVYKDGAFMDLNEAYNAGLVSKKAIEKAAKLYEEYKNPTE